MSSASLAVAYRPHPDRVRIAALSVAIALNLAVLLIALRPMAPQFIQEIRHVEAVPITWLTPKPTVPDPPPIEMAPAPKPVVTPRPHIQAPPATPRVATTTDEGSTPVPPVVNTPTIEPTTQTPPVVNTAPVEATLAYRSSPLTFPSEAIRRHLHGTVLLRVLVDADGKPVQVDIAQSSGQTLLDRSAREQVLANWRFQPATVQGHAVQAWAKVPVSFELREL
jgi:protein TonB